MKTVSTSGPSTISNPIFIKILDISSIVCVIGCFTPSSFIRPGSVTSMTSAANLACFFFSLSSVIFSSRRFSISPLTSFALFPTSFRSSAPRLPMERRISVSFPFFPSTLTLISSAISGEAASLSCFFASSKIVISCFCMYIPPSIIIYPISFCFRRRRFADAPALPSPEPLPHRFVHDHRSRRPCVQRFDGTLHRNIDQQIGALQKHIAGAVGLIAYNQRRRT